MVAFQDTFPSIFSNVNSNDTKQSCSSGNGGNTDFLVVSYLVKNWMVLMMDITITTVCSGFCYRVLLCQ